MNQELLLQARIACAMIEAMGMVAENQQRLAEGNSPAYVEKDFEAVILRHGIHHNAAIEACRE